MKIEKGKDSEKGHNTLAKEIYAKKDEEKRHKHIRTHNVGIHRERQR